MELLYVYSVYGIGEDGLTGKIFLDILSILLLGYFFLEIVKNWTIIYINTENK